MRSAVIIAAIALLGAVLLGFAGHKIMRNKSKRLSQIPGPAVDAFNAWMNTHNKQYKSPEELSFRRIVFFKNYLKVNAMNKLYQHKSALNRFADLTEAEFTTKYTGLKLPKDMKRNTKSVPATKPNGANWDWRTQGAVNPVKDQGQCGSCWAFSATSAIESAYKIAGNQLFNLAEQQMVDCGGSTGNYGCNGGWMDWAFQYIINTGGQEQTSDYPYTAVDGNCNFNSAKVAARIKSYTDIPQNACDQLLTSITQQPVSVAIAANGIMFYSSGVFTSTTCGTGLNHGVTAVGYGTDTSSGLDYWLVRNSWGSSWGEQGYIRMDRNAQAPTGICGICMVTSYPNV